MLHLAYTSVCMRVLDEPLVFVDIETNGLNPIRGRVIEVAAIRVENGVIVKEFNKLIDPGTELPRFITQLTGITGDDVRGAPVFLQVADELQEILDDAIFVAHNVRFDYSFLKQEFSRVGRDFSPRQLCTVRLSRALYPEYKSHKLANLIERHGFTYAARHRAYDDAHVLWQFMQHVESAFDGEILEQAIAKQIKRPSLPKNLDPLVVQDLPESHGVYIFEDKQGRPIYVGKSVNIKKRVMSHFNRDHEIASEFKIAQHIHAIRTEVTNSELEALLLESQLVKDLQPLYNKQLRRTNKLIIARETIDENGYSTVALEESNPDTIADVDSVLAVFPRRSSAKQALETAQKTYDLCPKLLGLEKSKDACFLYQLHKCRGACKGVEPSIMHNHRLQTAFDKQRFQSWPYKGAVTIQDATAAQTNGVIVDNWCVIATFKAEEECEPVITPVTRSFDLDAYKIIQSYLAQKAKQLIIKPISLTELAAQDI